MIGILDSGTGGENTLSELRKIAPSADVVFLKDVKNAPYGTKGRRELADIVTDNVRSLSRCGAEYVLIACCTASCVWELLPKDVRNISCPIIGEIAKRARKLTENGAVAVIATDGTVKSGAFSSLLGDVCRIEIASGELVSMVENGSSDLTVTADELNKIQKILLPLRGAGCDTLILGCTHFPSLERTLLREASKYGIKYTVSSAKEGVNALLRAMEKIPSGSGITVRI